MGWLCYASIKDSVFLQFLRLPGIRRAYQVLYHLVWSRFINYIIGYEVGIPLRYTEIDLQDQLWSPFPSADTVNFYFDIGEIEKAEESYEEDFEHAFDVNTTVRLNPLQFEIALKLDSDM